MDQNVLLFSVCVIFPCVFAIDRSLEKVGMGASVIKMMTFSKPVKKEFCPVLIQTQWQHNTDNHLHFLSVTRVQLHFFFIYLSLFFFLKSLSFKRNKQGNTTIKGGVELHFELSELLAVRRFGNLWPGLCMWSLHVHHKRVWVWFKNSSFLLLSMKQHIT